MFNRMRDFLYSLRSEKYKRKVMERAFAAVDSDEPETPPTAKNTVVGHRIVEAFIIGVLASLIATALWYLYGPK